MDEKVEFLPAYTTSNHGIVALVKSLFEAADISYYVDNEHAASVAFGKVTGGMTFMVSREHIDTAKELLEELKE